ncbi:MAG: YccF domain-containing protein [Bacteroidales bacterium]|nr:YccF domain-containing protein [Bacteroidales bacterium]
MNFIGNIIWFIFGGFIIAIEYFIASIILMITIIGIPFAFQTLKLASLALWPFGRQAVNIDQPTGCLSAILNIVWLLFGGIWIALSHIIFGLLFTITIIGIPFGAQHFKMASLALLPFGKTIKW